MKPAFESLVARVRACRLCESELALGPRPIVQVHPKAKILIAGQAPGSKVHTTGVPFDDPSGNRLRDWMGVDRDTLYDPSKIAILPMGFCYPGKGKSGDLPPIPRCAATWRQALLDQMQAVELTLVIGRYALAWHLGTGNARNLTDVMRRWRDYVPERMPLPHPSPRNNIWLRRNAWFEVELIPVLRTRVAEVLGSAWHRPAV